MPNLEHSKIGAGRITREELEYHLHFASVLEKDITSITSMSSEEVSHLRRSIIAKFDRASNACSIAYLQWVQYGFHTLHSQIEGEHGGAMKQFLYEGKRRIKGPSGMLPDLDHMAEECAKQAEYKKLYNDKMEPVRKAFRALRDEAYGKVTGWDEGSTAEREKMVQDFGGRVVALHEMLLDFILECLPGRTFVNSLH